MLGARLWRAGRDARQRSVLLWGVSFLATAAAALAGGTYHGFQLMLGASLAGALWKITVYAIGLGSALLFAGALLVRVTRPWRNGLLALALIKFVAYAVWMASHDDFRFVIWAYVPDMLGALALQFWPRLEGSAQTGSGWIVAGIVSSFVAAAVQQMGVSLHAHFNHNDLYHVLQAGAFAMLYKGGRLMQDCGQAERAHSI